MRENDPLGVVDSDERFLPPEDVYLNDEENIIDAGALLRNILREIWLERERSEPGFEHGENEKSGKAKEQMFIKNDRKKGFYGGKS